MAYTAQFPISSFLDVDGKPLENGYVYIGTAGLDPVANPQTVYWDAAYTQVAAQPIRTIGGYPSNNGVRSRIYVNAVDYSIKVTNVNGTDTVPVSLLNASNVFAADVIFVQAGAGAVPRTVESKLRDTVSVKDFGAVGNGVADDTVAIQAAIDATPVYGTTFFPAGTYIITATLNLKSNTGVDGQGATIKAKDAVNFEYMMLAASKTNVTVKNIRFDANKANRSAGQNVRFMCLGFTDCDDCTASNVYVENARGYSSIPAVGLAVGGSSIRCKIENCTAVNCGDSGANAADGFFASGESNLIIGCLATNCTDTGFVIESSNASGIVGCIARSCNAGAAITNAVNADKYGNFISGVSVFDWNSAVTGGIQIGCPLNTSTGALYDTVVSDVTVVAVTGGKGTGPAINLRQTGTPKAVRVTLNNVRIRTASAQGILVDADQVSIRGCDISGTTNACIQFQDGSTSNFVAGCQLVGGSFGITTAGNSSLVCESNSMLSQTSYGVYAFDASTIVSMFNVVQTPGVNYFGKDVGAALNLVGSQANNLAINNATGAPPAGALVDKFVVTDANGTPLGYVPVYNA